MFQAADKRSEMIGTKHYPNLIFHLVLHVSNFDFFAVIPNYFNTLLIRKFKTNRLTVSENSNLNYIVRRDRSMQGITIKGLHNEQQLKIHMLLIPVAFIKDSFL
jgi:hypothetical protein